MTALRSLETGQPERAIAPLLSILARDPDLARVRLELARAYFLTEQWGRAREEFFRVLSGDIPPAVQRTVLAFIRAIDNRRSVDWDLDIALVEAGDGRVFETDEIELDFGGGPLPSSVNRNSETRPGLRFRSQLELRQPLDGWSTADANLSVFGQIDANILEAPGTTLDDATVVGRFGLRHVSDRATLSIAPFVSRRFTATERYEGALGATLSYERRLDRGVFVLGQIDHSYRDNVQNNALDGHLTQLNATVQKSVDGQNVYGAGLLISNRSAPLDTENAVIYEARVFGSRVIRNGFVLEPSFAVGARDFKTPSPLLTEDPDETYARLYLRVEKQDLFLIDGFTPYATVLVQRTWSDVSAFSYQDNEVTIGLERRF